MTNRRTFTFLLAAQALALAALQLRAQDVPPAPPRPAIVPAAPMPASTPMPAMAPMPAMVPMPPLPPKAFDYDFDVNVNVNIDRAEIEEQVQAAREMAYQARDQVREQARGNAEMARASAEMARAVASTSFAFAPQAALAGFSKGRTGGSEDSLYQRGTSALDGKRWDDAVEFFTQAAAKNGPRADAAWK